MTKNQIEDFWQEFLQNTGRPMDTSYLEAFYFGHDEPLAQELLSLVLNGKKRATASSLLAFEATNMDVPKAGTLSIVTDFSGMPWCVIETTAVTVIPFQDMSFDICVREGEDECLETWVIGHKKFFTEEGKLLGYTFSEDMLVVFEDFEVVYRREQKQD